MGAINVYLRLFVAFSILLSLVLLPSTFVFLGQPHSLSESDWAKQEAWVLSRLAQRCASLGQPLKRKELLAQAHLVSGQLRWVKEGGEVLLSTKTGALPEMNLANWPAEESFQQWLTDKNSEKLKGFPPKTSTYLV